MTEEAPGGWFVLTVELGKAAVPEAVEWARTAFAREPVEIERAGRSHRWIDLYFESADEAEIAARVFSSHYPVEAWAVRSVENRDWQKFWRAHFRRQEIGNRLAIVPAWDTSVSNEERLEIRLEPGLSFGTGDHFTTRFCLEMLDKLFEKEPPSSFLDVGTGSGILAIAAAKCGCCRVVGLEYEELALEMARENVESNGVSEYVMLFQHDITDGWSEPPCEVVCANLFSNLLVQVAPVLLRAAQRSLILTGILERECDYVAEAYIGLGAREVVRDGDGEWSGLLFDVTTCS